MLSYLIIVVGILVSVAFIVLLERKVLGYIQLRKGPNKVGLLGILQSFGDAIKLFSREQIQPSYSNMFPYYWSPVVSFLVVLLIWILIPTRSQWLNMGLGALFFFCCTRFGVYTLLGRGWSSNSNYALLGCIRGVAQTISYEVSMVLLFLSLIFIVRGYDYNLFWESQEYCFLIFLVWPIFISWFSSRLAETNRTPFDFAEGESELVSGFNVEYGAGGFALLFLAEYASIIFISYLIVFIFFGGMGVLIFNLLGIAFCFIFIWVRGTLPRFRYDRLMYLAWKSYLPLALNLLVLYLNLSLVSLVLI